MGEVLVDSIFPRVMPDGVDIVNQVFIEVPLESTVRDRIALCGCDTGCDQRVTG